MNAGFPSLPDPALTIEVSPASVAEWHKLPADQRPRLIDCREQDELAICQISGNEWIPLGTIPQAAGDLAAASPHGVVVYCHHGMRSHRAASVLRASGLENAFSMAGGIDAWSAVIDPSVPRY